MYTIYVHDEITANKLFDYNSHVLPMIGDVYADPDKTTNHYQVTKRLLHTTTELAHVISIWVKKTH